jgi:transposase
MTSDDIVSPRGERETLPTIWEVTDDMWSHFIAPILGHLDPAPKRGRPRADQRRCLNGIIYRARTGCQWNQLPEKFGSDSTVHRTLARWEEKGVFDAIWALLIYHCEDLKDVHWEWQSADGTLHKARFIGSGKGGIKRNSQKYGHQKKLSNKQRPEKSKMRSKESAPTPRIVGKWGSRKAFLSRETVDRYLSSSLEPTSTTI